MTVHRVRSAASAAALNGVARCTGLCFDAHGCGGSGVGMGYDDLDRALLEAWYRHFDWNSDAGDDPGSSSGESGVPGVPGLSKMYRRPLRSWCVVLRADDRRLYPNIISYRPGAYAEDAAWIRVMVDRSTLEGLCSRVWIAWPGVSVGEAAARFGVNPTTVRRWVERGLLRAERDENRADAKRGRLRVWTSRAVDPTGEVIEGPWGSLTDDLVRKVCEDWEQILVLREKPLGAKSRVKQWRCEGCGRWVSKFYMPVAMAWMGEVLGSGSYVCHHALRHWANQFRANQHWANGDGVKQSKQLLCRGCHGVVYESSELTSRPGRGRRLGPLDRFVKRYSGGVLCGRDMRSS